MQTTCPTRMTLLLTLCALLFILFQPRAAAQADTYLEAVRATAQPVIDGSLNDPAWQGAKWFSAFFQSEPSFGKPSSERTEAAFMFDSQNIYIGVRCFDSSPNEIIAWQLMHRGSMERDDIVEIMLDTYGDQQRGFLFIANPLGAKEDSQISGNSSNRDWNEVWEVRSSIDDAGWYAEFRIPLRVLRFEQNASRPWRVNVQRTIRRKREDVYIAAPQPPFNISNLSFAVELRKLDLQPAERNLQVIPYGLVGVEQKGDDGDNDTTSDAGLDVKYSLTSNLTLDLTFNTDFAQVEADTQQINLTRFSLYYPEKRGFFLENSQLFGFGYNGGGGQNPELLPFFSRRIGIEGTREVQIDAGARLTGKVGDLDVGLLAVKTGDAQEIGVTDASYLVARTKRSLGGRSNIGAIVTHSERGGFSSSTYGVDGTWWASDGLALSGQVLTVDQDALTDQHTSWKVTADFTADLWGYLIDHTEVGSNFLPDLGFVRRTGFNRSNVFLRWSQRPGNWIRKGSIRTNSSWLYSMDGVLEEKNHNLRYEIDMESGDHIEFEGQYTFERLFEPFRLNDDIVFANGDYGYKTFQMSFETEDSRRWKLEGDASFGEYYSADRRDLGLSARYDFDRHFQATVDLSNYDIDAGDANINWTLMGLNLQCLFTSSLSLGVYTQYNSSSGDLITNVRLHLLYENDSDLFIVFNERRFEDQLDHWRLENRQALVKMNYRFFF